MIVDVLAKEELQAAFETISQRDSRPAEEAKKTLQKILEGDSAVLSGRKNIESVKFAVHFIEKNISSRTVSELTDSTFGHYQQIIFNRLHWVKFEPVFDLNREIFMIDFKNINDLRNIVFHFRRGVTPRDTDRLRRFRDSLRYNRGLFHEKRKRGNS